MANEEEGQPKKRRVSAEATSSPLPRRNVGLSDPRLLWAFLALGGLLRIGHIFALRATPWFNNLSIDPEVYDAWGQRIAAGDWLGNAIFYQDPLYPYFLGLIYWVFGHDLLVVRLLQAAIGIATCVLVARVGKRLFDDKVGNLAAIIAALYLPSIFYEAQIEKSFLAVFLIVAITDLLLRPSTKHRVAAGFLLGLACLVRANFLLIVPLIAWLLVNERGPAASETEKGSSRWRSLFAFTKAGAKQSAAFLIGLACALGPVTLRNHHVGGEWVMTTAQGGPNFYIGNNPSNRSGRYVAPPFVRANPKFEQQDFLREAQTRMKRRVTSREASNFWFKAGLDHLRQSPSWAASLFWLKFKTFWNDYEVPDNQDLYFLSASSRILALPLPTFGWILPLALVGALFSLRRNRASQLLAAYTAIYCLSIVSFFILARYRLPVLPALFIFAALGLIWFKDQFRSRAYPRLALAALLLLITAAVSFRGHDKRNAGFAQGYTNLAAIHVRNGQYPAAIAAYGRALKENPRNANTLRDLGVIHTRQGKFQLAEDALTKSVSVNPKHPDAWLYLGRLYDAQRKFVEAKVAYRNALKNRPASAEAAFNLATDEQRSGNYQAAVQIYQQMMKLHPQDVRIIHNLSIAYFYAGNLSLARQNAALSASRGKALPAKFLQELAKAEALKAATGTTP